MIDLERFSAVEKLDNNSGGQRSPLRTLLKEFVFVNHLYDKKMQSLTKDEKVYSTFKNYSFGKL